MATEVLKGSCHCGTVEFEYTRDEEGGKPVFSLLCHCEICRKVNGSSAVHLLGVPKSAFKITKGEASVVTYAATPAWTKRFCSVCGVPISHGPNAAPFYGTYPTNYEAVRRSPHQLPEMFKPTMHVNFENALIPDIFRPACAIPKFQVFPKELGGTGNLME